MTTTLTTTAPAEDPVIALVLNSLHSPRTRDAYRRHLRNFLEFSAGREFSRPLVMEYRQHLQAQGASTATLNQALSAIKKLATEAADNRWFDQQTAATITSVKGFARRGRRTGNWLSLTQAQTLLDACGDDLRGRRDKAVFALLLGGGIRREEAATVQVRQFQQREGRAVIADLLGKGEKLRTVPLPDWAEEAVRVWLASAAIYDGPILRAVAYDDTVREALSVRGVWYIVTTVSRRCGARVAPHDLRRTHATLARGGGAEIDAIQWQLGHASVTTTEGYLRGVDRIADAPCDRLGLR